MLARLRDERGLRARAPSPPTDPRAPLPPVRPPLAAARPSAASEYAAARDRRKSSSRSTSRRSRRRRRGDRRIAPVLLPRRGARARVADELRRRHPSAHVVASHEVAPEFREYERASTTAVDAYLGPVLSRYLVHPGTACAGAGLPKPLVMRSSGGLATLEEAAAHAAFALLSGQPRGRERLGSRRSRASRTRSRSTWAAPRPTSARSSTARRGASTSARRRSPGASPHPRRAHRRRGGRVDRPAGRGRRASRALRARGRSWACVLRERRSARDRDRRQPAPRPPAAALPAGSSSTRRAAERALGAVDPGGGRHRERGDGAGAPRRLRRAGARPARLRARRLRRRRPASRPCARQELGMRLCSSRPPPESSPRSASSPRTSAATQCGRTSPPSPTQASCPPTERRPSLHGSVVRASVPLGPDLAQRFHDAHEARYGYADCERSIELVGGAHGGGRAAPPLTATEPPLSPPRGPRCSSSTARQRGFRRAGRGATDAHWRRC